MAPPARRRGLTPSETVRKLLAYTAAMFLAPFAAYPVSQSLLLPAAHARYGWRAIQDEGGRAVWSGVAAVLAVNAVLVAYVVSAAFEENGFGRNPMVDARADARETEGDGREKRE